MESKAESRATRKHRTIVEAAMKSFLSKGFDGTSMDDVASHAQVSKPTVYKYFADKESLFAEVVRSTTDQIDGLVRVVAETLNDTVDVDKGLTELARRFLNALLQPEVLRLRRLVIANAERFPTVGRDWYEQGFARVLTTLAGSFQSLASRNLLRTDNALIAAHHFVGLVLWIPVNKAMFTGTLPESDTAEIESHARAAVRTFLNGYGALASSHGTKHRKH